MLPSFLVIGATKSGTTALYDYLRQHPAIFMPALKEPRFFLYDGLEASARFPVRSLEEYEALFAPVTTETALGEATPQYLTSWAAMERIHETLPGARLIAALRDPAERAFSIYLMNLRNRGHNREIPFAEALGDDINLRRGYAPYLGRWRELFGAERLGIVLFEDIVRDAVATTRGLYGFLGVDPAHVPAFTGVVNPGGLPKRPLVHKLLSDKRLRETARRVLPAHPGPDRPQPLGLAGAMTGNVTWIVLGRINAAAPSYSPARGAAAMIRAVPPALQPGDCPR